jgi:hypothetical protein
MTRDDIIRMAREASFRCGPNEVYVGGYNSTEDLVRFANLVAAAEREACVQLIERTDLSGLKYEPDIQLLLAAILNAHVKAIRARGQS